MTTALHQATLATLVARAGACGDATHPGPWGQVVWWINSPGYVFRAQRVYTLYRPRVGSAR